MRFQLCALLANGLMLSTSHYTYSQEGCQKDQRCTMVVYSEQTDKWQIINKSRAERAFSPFSTYKIPNTLILLEEQKIDTKTSYKVDTHAYPVQKWWPSVWQSDDIKVKDAFSYSVLPLYQMWTNSLNKPEIKTYLSQFNYGNQDINGPLDEFWLNSSLQISAMEQIEFLRRLDEKTLGLSKQTYQTFDAIFLKQSTSEYQLYAKTGTGPIAKKTYLGWYVGKIENAQGTHYFAFNMHAPSFKEMVNVRVDKAHATLKALKII
ncbi:penicillin-binding transpeptidase domain-containing protein [Pseudoalteromonas obscura]|uniref:Penicillin-binding transpeptidase domain-containing protein n=1 Tax=Pseudoalteromonas obscura TaxID=3048491 RepID=A0ABT7EM15_9GAMM|nr:penicillin-binding transpeptidase domain-containing protein [Pseudoalteromonas sp. P94(2023)]MDK2596076.1 penicillin-binding transpeptidase domain-containing protein [Pseudoalteromonas sp. P94(2023)]